MSRKRAEPVTEAAPAVPVMVHNPGTSQITATCSAGSVRVRPGETVQAPAWISTHPAVVGARPVLVIVGG